MNHNKTKLKCPVCFEVFTSPITHAVHKRKIHGLYDCKYCAAELPSKSEWSLHLREKHKDKCKDTTEKKVMQIKVHTREGTASITQAPDVSPLHTRPAEGQQLAAVNIIQEHPTPNNEFVANLMQASNDSSSINKKLLVRNMAFIAPKPSSGIIMSTSQGINFINTPSVQALAPVVPPPLPYTLGNTNFNVNSSENLVRSASNPATIISSPPINANNLIIKEEPMEEESAKPNTVLVKVKPQKRNLPTTDLANWFSCDSCSSSFKNLTGLKIHIGQKHTNKPRCPLCNTTKTTARKVYQHQAMVHRNKLRCHYYCLELFDTREELSAHHNNVHHKKDTLSRCRYCRETYLKGTYLKHSEVCTAEIKNKLIIHCACGTEFINSDEYADHIKSCASAVEMDGEEKGEAPTTSNTSNSSLPDSEKIGNTSNSSLLDSEKIGNTTSTWESSTGEEDKTMKCLGCQRFFHNEKKAISHVIKHHKAALSYGRQCKICFICGKFFVLGLAFCKHLLEHYERGGMWDRILPSQFVVDHSKVRCWICHTEGLSYSEYHHDSRNTAIEKIFSSKTYESSAADENDDSYCCVCEESFKGKLNFWKHIKIHLSKSLISNPGEILYMKCPKCDFSCNARFELEEHAAVHCIQQRGETLVDMDDKSEGEGKATNKDHGEGTFECKLCQVMFYIKSSALSHVLTQHKKEVEEVISAKDCPICDKSFVRPFAFCSHLLNHYTDLGMWEKMVPRDLLSKVDRDIDKKFCWICKSTIHKTGHQTRRNDLIEKSLVARVKDLEEDEPFQCPMCEFSCYNRYTHWKHVKLHMCLNRKSLKLDPEHEPELATDTEDSENLTADSKDLEELSSDTENSEFPIDSEELEKKKFDCLRCSKQFIGIKAFHKHLAMYFLRPWNKKKKQTPETVVESKGMKESEPMTLRSKAPKPKCSSVKCVCCKKTFNHGEGAVAHVLSTHKMTVSEKNLLECCVCDISFKSEWWLCRHILNHYSNLGLWDRMVPRDLASRVNERNKCWVCNCTLNSKYTPHTIKRNAYITSLLAAKCKLKEIPFDCLLCHQEFPTRHQYWVHMILHLTPVPSEDTTWMASKQAEKENKCDYCSMSFQKEGELDAHLPSHFLEYMYEDDPKAEPSFRTASKVSDDENIQTGDSSSSSDEDEWLPPSEVKKRKLEEMEEMAGMAESNNSTCQEECDKTAAEDDGMFVDLADDDDDDGDSGNSSV